MRLWHKDLIPVLPRKQLIGQWRECCLIAKNIAQKEKPNHLLVNRIMNYPLSHFYSYGMSIYDELTKREYNVKADNFVKWFDPNMAERFHVSYIFNDWHNNRYFQQCFYNLEEKYDCGGISEEEWRGIVQYVQNRYKRH